MTYIIEYMYLILWPEGLSFFGMLNETHSLNDSSHLGVFLTYGLPHGANTVVLHRSVLPETPSKVIFTWVKAQFGWMMCGRRYRRSLASHFMTGNAYVGNTKTKVSSQKTCCICATIPKETEEPKDKSVYSEAKQEGGNAPRAPVRHRSIENLFITKRERLQWTNQDQSNMRLLLWKVLPMSQSCRASTVL